MPKKREPKNLLRLDQLSNKPVSYRIPGLLTMTGNVLINAYRKAGKTSLILDLMSALTSDRKFLSTLACRNLNGPMVYLNIELEQSMLRNYAETAGLADCDDVLFLDYCGAMSQFRIEDPIWREDIADILWDVHAKALVIDPFQPIMAMSGGDSNSNDEGREKMELLGEIRAGAELDHLFVIDHTGHADKTRARGASAKEDWADVLWNVQSSGAEGNGRLLTAVGRGVQHTQIQYELDSNGQLTTTSNDGKPGPKPKAGNRVFMILKDAGDALTADEIMAADPTISKASVYRALEQLESLGSVASKTRRGTNASEYRVP